MTAEVLFLPNIDYKTAYFLERSLPLFPGYFKQVFHSSHPVASDIDLYSSGSSLGAD